MSVPDDTNETKLADEVSAVTSKLEPNITVVVGDVLCIDGLVCVGDVD